MIQLTAKLRKKNFKTRRFSKGTALGIGAMVTIVAIVAYFGINSMIPVNSNHPVFIAPRNNYLKALHTPQNGYVFASQSVSSGKKSGGGPSSVNPTINLIKNSVEVVHVINEDGNSDSKHNFNIDEFNVHTRDLKYFESQSITFISDKVGSFQYYCTIHPEMKGTVMVSEK
jgi:hypothetical protein